jgi:Ca2+-binding RTX toxin-like protein
VNAELDHLLHDATTEEDDMTRSRWIRFTTTVALATLPWLANVPAANAATPSLRCWGRPATIVGTPGDDQLVGTTGPDVIAGRGGDDFIKGLQGNDLLCGDGGDDFLSGGKGNDRIDSGSGNNGFSGDEGDDVLQGGPGPDDNANYLDAPGPIHASLAGGTATGQGHDTLLPGVDELFGGPFDDTLIGDDRGQLLVGAAGNDTLQGGDGDDLLAGGTGDDLLDGGAGLDVLDDLEFGLSNVRNKPVHLDLVAGTETGHGHDTLVQIEGEWGSPGDDVLIGDENQNVLIGADGDDVVQGAGGDDIVEGDAGIDQLDGGPGIDYSSSFGSPTAVVVDLAAGTLVGTDPTIDHDTLANIEDVQGSSFGDTITGDSGPNALRGDPGADTIGGGGGGDSLIGDCGTVPGHFFYEDVFDCSKPNRPDSLDGGMGTDICLEGEELTACEVTTPSTARGYRGAV